MRISRHNLSWTAAAAGLLAAAVHGTALGQTATATKPNPEAILPATCHLKVDGKQSKVTLVGRTDTSVLFVLGSSSVGQRREIAVERIEACYFELKYPYALINRAIQARDWASAARVLYPALQPVLPYLHVPENNAVEECLALGNYMKRAAEGLRATAATEEQQERVKEQLKAAFRVFNHLGKARWSSTGLIGRLKSYQCLMALDKPKTARTLFAKLPEPVQGDRAYGLYWLVQSELDIEEGKYRTGMHAAVKSLCFENKDIDTFPDALLASAQCYEEEQQWYRARDVYYEVACIFPFTDWSEMAVRRLRFIMDRGLTKEQEKSPIESVFFSLDEDMNQKVRDLFEKIAAGPKTLYENYVDKADEASKDVEDEDDNLDLDVPDE